MRKTDPRILLVDDHPIVIEGLRRLIFEQVPSAGIGIALTANAALDELKRQSWDMIVLDISLPDRSGLDLLKQFRQINSSLPILVLSIHPEEQYAVRVLKAKTADYLTKNSPPEMIQTAVLKVLEGGRYLSPELADRLAQALNSREKPEAAHEALSDRELQVLCMIAGGKGVKEIGDELCLSVKTVSTYRARILEKMGKSNNAELIHYAILNNLVPEVPKSARKHERFIFEGEAIISAQGKQVPGNFKNISLSGACVQLNDALEQGELIGFIVQNPSTRDKIEGEAHIVWCGSNQYGIKFCNPPEQLRKTIYKWSRHLEKQG